MVSFARELIVDGNRPAARAINKVVRVLGSDLNSERVIKNICEYFGLNAAKEERYGPHRRYSPAPNSMQPEHLAVLIVTVGIVCFGILLGYMS